MGLGENFHLIPSRFDFSDNLIRSINLDERVLAKFLSNESELRKKDLVLIDCAPTESIITRTAYYASRYILVPVRTEFFSTIGFPLLKESLDKFKFVNPSHAIDVCGVLINNSETKRSARGPHHQSALRDIKKKASEYHWPLMRNQMFHSRGYPKLMSDKYPVYTGNAVGEFRRIADEFVRMVGLLPYKE